MIRTAMLLMDENLNMQGFGLTNSGDIAFAAGKKLVFGDGTQLTTAPVAATNAAIGLVKPDGTTITVDPDGTIHATGGGGGGYVLPKASTTTLGGVMIDGSTVTIDANGVITAHTNYVLPVADTNTTGGVKVGGPTGLTMLNGFAMVNLSSTLSGMLVDAASGTLRLKLGSGVALDVNGALTATGSSGVTSLNGQTGAVTLTVNGVGTNTNAIVLTTANIGEGSNLYFTNARAVAAISGNAISPSQLQTNSIAGTGQLIIGNPGGVAVEGGDLQVLGHNFVATGTVQGGGITTSNGFMYSSTSRLDLQKTVGGYVDVFANTYSVTNGFLYTSTQGGTNNAYRLDHKGGSAAAPAGYAELYALSFFATNSNANYNDIAEFVPVPTNPTLTAAEQLGAADVAIVDPANDEAIVRHAGTQYDRTVAGVISTAPAYAINNPDPTAPPPYPMLPLALAGRVPTKVTTKYVKADGTVVARPINKGDLVVASSVNGHAMAADPSDCPNGTIPPGSILGKAMQTWNPAPGDAQEGQIKVWVNLG